MEDDIQNLKEILYSFTSDEEINLVDVVKLYNFTKEQNINFSLQTIRKKQFLASCQVDGIQTILSNFPWIKEAKIYVPLLLKPVIDF